jgi:hypothetical protein
MTSDGNYSCLFSIPAASPDTFVDVSCPTETQCRPTCLYEQHPQLRVASFAYSSGAIYVAGLETFRCKADVTAYLPTTLETMRIVDDGNERLCCARADAGDCLQ